MKRLIPIHFILIFAGSHAFGQDEFTAMKRLYHVADSINKTGKTWSPDSSLYSLADSLGHLHPAGYFRTAAELMSRDRHNDAAFIYYVGYLRFRYYNSSNPDYQPDGDGALFASLSSVAGESVKMYLRTNIDNFIAVLTQSIAYCKDKDYNFFPRKKNPANHDKLISGVSGLVSEMEKHKEKYTRQWADDRKDLEKKIDAEIELEKTIIPEKDTGKKE